MKKMIAVLLAIICIVSCAAAETNAMDVTYKYLYTNMLSFMRTNAETENEYMFDVTCVTVWKKTDDKAGFSFEGDEWAVSGETDMETGVVTKLMCVIPYNQAGLAMTYMLAYTLSGMTSVEEFKDKYLGGKSVFKTGDFGNYIVSLDAGNDITMVYEYSLLGSVALNNADNKCSMMELIQSLQR